MSKVQILRALVKQRLTAAAEDIFGLFERTIAEYEETLCRSKEENERQRRLLDAVFNPQLRLHRADVQQLLVSKEEVPPEQQDWNPSVEQEDPEPPHIKEEQEEVWTSQAGEQLQGLEEADITKITFTPVPVKSEDDADDEEKPQSSQLHQRQTEQMETEADGEDCGGAEPARNSHPDTHLTPDTDKIEDSSELERDDGNTDGKDPDRKSFHCSVCGKTFKEKGILKRHMRTHTGVSQEEVPPEQQAWSSSLDEEDPEPPHIKEEQEEVWTSQEGDQLQGLEEADITKFTFTLVPVKSEDDDEEKPQSSQSPHRQTEQMETEADGEDCGGPEPARNSHPDTHLTPDTDKIEDSSEPERDDGNKDGKDPDRKSFHCSVCGKTFKEKGILKRHMRTHTGVKPFCCTFCSKTFTQKTDLDCHLQTHTGERPFSCPLCSKTFGKKAYLQKHLKSHTGEKPYSCSICDKCFSRGDSLQSHMRTHTGEKPYSCSFCNKCFSRSDNLQAHMKIHTGEKLHSCSFCNKCFPCNSDLQSHIRIHTDEKPLSCSVCDKTFTQRSHLKNHKCGGELTQLHELWTSQEGEQLHRLEEADITKFTFTPVPVKSEDDDEEKPQSSQLHERQTEQITTEADGEDCGGPEPARNSHPDSHLQPATHDKTSDSSEPETDDSCDWVSQSSLNPLLNDEVPVSDKECNTGKTSVRSSESATSFVHKEQKHNGSQTGVEPFSCSVCGKRYHLKSLIAAHMRLHCERKRFRCSVCKKAFLKRAAVVIHMRIHTGEKPFNCSICGLRFAQHSHLTTHLRVHTGEKPFSCSACGKGFAQMGHLRQHSIVHTGEKPFSCSICGKGFTLKGLLRRHSIVHTGEKPFSCSVCGEGFTRKGHLRRHSTIHTGEKPFSCSVCDKGFARKEHLRQHSTVHRREKLFSCSVCDKGFTRLTRFKKHKCPGESSRS